MILVWPPQKKKKIKDLIFFCLHPCTLHGSPSLNFMDFLFFVLQNYLQ